MALTDKSDFFAAVHEEGINSVIKHVMRQRPSLFNYGTALIAATPELLCEPIEVAPGVTRLITVQPPLPLLGASSFALNYCFQLTDLTLEFHPGDTIELPAELDPPLAEQRVAFRARGCGGLGCPSKGDRPLFEPLFDLDRVVATRALPRPDPRGGGRPPRGVTAGLLSTGTLAGGAGAGIASIPPGIDLPSPPTGTVFEPTGSTTHVFPTRELSCFCLDLLGTGQGSITGPVGTQAIQIKLDDLEIVDLAPEGLENSLECYVLLVVNQVVLDEVNDAVSKAVFRTIDFGEIVSLDLAASTAVPANPAIEENQLKAFIDLGPFGVNIPPIVVESGGGGNGGDSDETETDKPRTRTGPFHLTAAVSENAFVRVFEGVRDNTTFDITIEPRNILAGFKAGAKLKFHLAEGSVEFGDDVVKLDELDIKWDKLELNFAIDLPELCFPPARICIPGLGCTPQWCIFEGDNDVVFPPLNIPAVFTSEVSADLRPKVSYVTSSEGNKWKVAIAPFGPVDIDIIDVSATIGDLLDDMIEAVTDTLDVPDFVGDVLGVIVEAIKAVLDVGDDAQEWIKDLVFDSLGVELGIDNLIFKLLADEFKILDQEDPLEVLSGDDPVRIPIEFIGATVDEHEITIGVDVGA